jgi:sugar O-acyltransferase (sialic acid O-acetyltransferase NeuD family)
LKTKNLLIAGTSGFALECYGQVLDVLNRQDVWKEKFSAYTFKGFLGPDNRLKRFGLEKYYLGDENDFDFKPEDSVVVGVGEPDMREKVFDRLKKRKVHLINLISPFCLFPEGVEIGEGNIIAPYCLFARGAKIGNGNVINSYTSMAHDSEIGDFNELSSYCNLTGHTKMKDLNFLGPGVKMLPKSRIGSNCKVTAGSVVYKGFKDNAIVTGNPAYKVGIVDK